jgi:hypothetical protein
MGILMSKADVCERYLAEFIEQYLRAASFSISTLTLAFHSRFIDRIEAEDEREERGLRRPSAGRGSSHAAPADIADQGRP